MKKIFLLPIAVLALSFAPVQNGMVLNMTVSSTKGMNGTIKVMHDVPGTRIEMNATVNSGFSFAKTSILKKSEPTIVYQLDDKSKTYMTVDVSNAGSDNEPATATLIGTDSINGFKCKHVKVKQGNRNWEFWNTASITEYNQFSGVMNKQKYIGNQGVHDALKLVGAEGFPVKTILTDKDGTTTTELKSVEHKVLDASLFTVPSNYKKGGSTGMGYPGH